VVSVKNLPHKIEFSTLVRASGSTSQLESLCFGYMGEEDDDFRCLQDSELQRTENNELDSFSSIIF